MGEIKIKMLGWVNRFNIFLLLDNQNYRQDAYHKYEYLLAAGVQKEVTDAEGLKKILSAGQWHFGHLSFEFANYFSKNASSKISRIGFPDLYFFVPQIIVCIQGNTLTLEAEDPDRIFEEIISFTPVSEKPRSKLRIQSGLDRESYIQKINSLKEHIHRGDCYEINFCMEFFSEEAEIHPHQVFRELMQVSPNPFSAFYRLNNQFLLCASPERFLMKKENQLVSQPIKGTIRRNHLDTERDELLKKELKESAKEQSENVMVVDLVRNDLSKICLQGTVKVEELFGIYSFPQVHQMVSTISGELQKGQNFLQILEAVFPMGSMTGAPKHRVLELIDEYEQQARGIFSGAVGYISPEENFDFNVVIRSIMYNSQSKYLSYQVGSGITFYSDAEKEWEECILKAEAIKKVLAISDQH